MLRLFFKLFGFYSLLRSAARGPRALVTFLLRRQARRVVNRKLRKVK